MLGEPLVVAAKVAAALDALRVRYVVGGSLASAVYGIPRATQDVDLVAELKERHIDALASALAGEFYIDTAMIREALRLHRCFNVIHLETMFKADVFIPAQDPWVESELERGRSESVAIGNEVALIRFASPEDTLLHKLVWYQMGGGVSDRQWSDVLGVLKVQGELLDRAYVTKWAAHLGVAELLRRAQRAGDV